MNRKKKNIIIILLCILSLSGVICIRDSGFIQREITKTSKAGKYIDSIPIHNNITYCQIIKPQYAKIKSIAIQISRKTTFMKGEEGELTFSLYDNKKNLLSASTMKVSKMKSKNYTEIPVNCKVNTEEEYYYEIKVEGCENQGPTIRMWNVEKLGLSENIRIECKNQKIVRYGTVAKYIYEVPIDIEEIVLYDAWIIIMTMLFYTIWKLLRK